MVKVLFLSLLVAMMCGLASTLPAPQLARSFRQELFVSPPPSLSPVLEDPATRNERSTNLSYITGTARKIQLFIKNRHLQLLPDGTVNGTDDATSVYTILQRMTVGVGKMKIQGVSTCQYLCMDCSGMLYGSREFGDECVFNELMEHNHYNTYYSTKYSNDKRTFYLAMNRKGQPKKVILKARQQLGHMSSFTKVLTRPVTTERTESGHPVRHHAHLCSVLAAESPSSHHDEQYSATNRAGRSCMKKKKKRKKKKKKCDTCNENGPQQASPAAQNAKRHNRNKVNKVNNNKKCENKNSEECQRVPGVSNNNNNNKKRQKKFGGDRQQTVNGKKKKKPPKKNKKSRVLTTTELPSTVMSLTTEEDLHDEDYTIDSTHWDWDADSTTPHPEESISTSTTVTHPD